MPICRGVIGDYENAGVLFAALSGYGHCMGSRYKMYNQLYDVILCNTEIGRIVVLLMVRTSRLLSSLQSHNANRCHMRCCHIGVKLQITDKQTKIQTQQTSFRQIHYYHHHHLIRSKDNINLWTIR